LTNTLQKAVYHCGINEVGLQFLSNTLGLYPLMYPVRPNFISASPEACHSTHTAGRTFASLVWVLAVLLLVSTGITYRVLGSHLKLTAETAIRLPVPLSAFPMKINNWVGTDLSIRSTTREYMEKNFADDFLSRRYINSTNAWVDVYVVYCSSRPGGIVGHQPRICYPAGGWIHDGTEPSQFFSWAGRHIPCLMHRFHKPAPTYEQTIVASFYILNGRITSDESNFSGPLGRRPNIAGDPARYVAQVQISSVLENSIRTAAEEITELILDFLPDRNGKVAAVQFTQIPAGDAKREPSGDK